MLRLISLLLCALLTLPATAGAQDFDAAVAAWLEGDDATSLPALAELAAEGDADARVLLARIETQDKGPSPFRLALTPSEARSLFRWTSGPGGFARGWLSTEAKRGNRLAEAFLNAKFPNPSLDTIAALYNLGEFQATDYPSRVLALYGDAEMRAILMASDNLLEELKPYLAYLSWTPEPRGDGLAALRHIVGEDEAVWAEDSDSLGMAGLLALGYPYGDIRPENRWRPDVEEWLLTTPATRPIALLCEAECPEEQAACAFAFLALSGGYFEVIRLDSPSETYIPQEEFLSSPRARIMTLRRAALARHETNLTWLANRDGIAEISACAADLVVTEREAYRGIYP